MPVKALGYSAPDKAAGSAPCRLESISYFTVSTALCKWFLQNMVDIGKKECFNLLHYAS